MVVAATGAVAEADAVAGAVVAGADEAAPPPPDNGVLARGPDAMTPASAIHANTLSIMAVASQLTSSVAVYSAIVVRLTAVAIEHLNTSVLLLQHKHAAATAWFLRWHQRESYRVLEVTGLSSRRSNGRHSCRGRLRQPHKLLGPALHRKVPVAVVALDDVVGSVKAALEGLDVLAGEGRHDDPVVVAVSDDEGGAVGQQTQALREIQLRRAITIAA